MSRTRSGRDRFSTSVQFSLPQKSRSTSRSSACTRLPIAPSQSRTRSRSASRRCGGRRAMVVLEERRSEGQGGGGGNPPGQAPRRPYSYGHRTGNRNGRQRGAPGPAQPPGEGGVVEAGPAVRVPLQEVRPFVRRQI